VDANHAQIHWTRRGRIIPIPTLAGAFKSKFTANPDYTAALTEAAAYSLSTFSIAEALAIPLSIIVGIWAGQNKP